MDTDKFESELLDVLEVQISKIQGDIKALSFGESPKQDKETAELLYSLLKSRELLKKEETPRKKRATYAVQVDGLITAHIEVPLNTEEREVRETAFRDFRVASRIQGRKVTGTVVVPGRLINIITEELSIREKGRTT